MARTVCPKKGRNLWSCQSVPRKKGENPMSWFTRLQQRNQQIKQKARCKSLDAKLKQRKGLGCAFSFREMQLFQLVSTTYFSLLPPPILWKSVKLLIVFNSPVLDAVSTISLLKLLLLLALMCPDCSSPPRSWATRVRALEILASCHECKQWKHAASLHQLTSDACAYNTL